MNYFDLWTWLFAVRNRMRYMEKVMQAILNRKAAQKASVDQAQEATVNTQAVITDLEIGMTASTAHSGSSDNPAATLWTEAETISAATELAAHILTEIPFHIDTLNDNLPNSIAQYEFKAGPVAEHTVSEIDQEINSVEALFVKLVTIEVILGTMIPVGRLMDEHISRDILGLTVCFVWLT
ncbi:hypothetical protein PTNB73_08654 [Pyrenophora teres f. teres]|nr:hypothetical protein HRS9139_08767 [Pyrenophora teres f. teres]KAE8834754.1 hypothetical protein PTNB85_06087 [Pyrenophora teres f. teres]KAE8843768.1 hypothetical protein HRS9122_04871 [Pyrenophora teres f. teres]KAE8859174.1 hypothetical protein PTNB73_08654 [Pyrenophora teres f. teres]